MDIKGRISTEAVTETGLNTKKFTSFPDFCRIEGKIFSMDQLTMKVLKKHYSAFERMVTESTLITHNSNTSNILNSKPGYNRSCIPRLTVSMGQSVVSDPLRSTEYPNTEVEQILETDDRRKKKSRGRERDRGGNDNIDLLTDN